MTVQKQQEDCQLQVRFEDEESCSATAANTRRAHSVPRASPQRNHDDHEALLLRRRFITFQNIFKYVLFHELLSLLLRNLVTPEDYEPPGFKAASSDNFSFEHEPMNIKVGDVSTVGSLLYDVLVFNYSPDITYDISLLYE